MRPPCTHLRVVAQGHVQAVDVVRVLWYPVRLAHEEVDQRVGQHVVSCFPHHCDRRLYLLLPALQQQLQRSVMLSAQTGAAAAAAAAATIVVVTQAAIEEACVLHLPYYCSGSADNMLMPPSSSTSNRDNTTTVAILVYFCFSLDVLAFYIFFDICLVLREKTIKIQPSRVVSCCNLLLLS